MCVSFSNHIGITLDEYDDISYVIYLWIQIRAEQLTKKFILTNGLHIRYEHYRVWL